MADIKEITEKYIKRKPIEEIEREPYKQNLQAEINKVDAITRKLSEKQAHPDELRRLRASVMKLLGAIDLG